MKFENEFKEFKDKIEHVINGDLKIDELLIRADFYPEVHRCKMFHDRLVQPKNEEGYPAFKYENFLLTKDKNLIPITIHGDLSSFVIFYTKLEKEDPLQCDLDGNCLSVVRKDFINLQESPAIFIELTPKQIEAIEELKKND